MKQVTHYHPLLVILHWVLAVLIKDCAKVVAARLGSYEMRRIFDSEGGWTGLFESFARAASG
jgi:hypothetical protein